MTSTSSESCTHKPCIASNIQVLDDHRCCCTPHMPHLPSEKTGIWPGGHSELACIWVAHMCRIQNLCSRVEKLKSNKKGSKEWRENFSNKSGCAYLYVCTALQAVSTGPGCMVHCIHRKQHRTCCPMMTAVRHAGRLVLQPEPSRSSHAGLAAAYPVSGAGLDGFGAPPSGMQGWLVL